jgi:hypothetical protein
MSQSVPPQTTGTKKMSPVVVIAIILGGLVVVGGFMFFVIAGMGVYGAKKYMVSAKTSEAKSSVSTLARGITTCVAKEDMADGLVLKPGAKLTKAHALPPTSTPVPASLNQIKGMKYQSAPSDWAGQEVFQCAKFSMDMPQYFQYQWIKNSETEGVIRAVADLDGDGTIDQRVEATITCSKPGECTMEKMVESAK